MKRILICLIILIIFGKITAFAQIQRDSIIRQIDNYYFNVNNECYTLKNNNSTFQLFLNDSSIQKQKGLFAITDYYYEKKTNNLYLYFTGGMESNVWSFSIDKRLIKELFNKSNTGIHAFSKNKICYQKIDINSDSSNFFISGYNSKSKKELTIINKFLNKKGLSIGEIIAYPSNESILISMGIMEQGGFLNPKYYLYNIHTNSLSEFKIPKKLQSTFGEHGVWLKHYNLDKSYAFLDSTIIDSNFNYYGKRLRLYTNIHGFIFKNNNLIRLIVQSETDEKDRFGNPGKSVLIQYTPSPHRERIMYRLYHDKMLAREELVKFDAFELRLFRNMIFAKHNYDFNDKYLTAYFNLYSFYKWEKDSRTKDMSGKLTEADKQNLKLIKSMENEK